VSWRDPGNWLAGNATVPQFLDPSYPYQARHASVVGLPIDFGATHYVGVAGVGRDAATYKRGDPATANKRGVFSYDGAAALTEIMAGRGTSNTMIMIQVPHDRGAGVSPWIAGGGATVRGVPETNSIEPFVLGKDKNDKSIGHQGKKGTFVLMADGSVRFVDQSVSDEVFKAMATIEGGAPEKFDLKTDPATPLIPSPDAKEAPVKKSDPPKSTDGKTPDKTSDAPKTTDGKTPDKTPDAPNQTADPKSEKVPDAKPADKKLEVKPVEKKLPEKGSPADKQSSLQPRSGEFICFVHEAIEAAPVEPRRRKT
jgi:hypothetical protein